MTNAQLINQAIIENDTMNIETVLNELNTIQDFSGFPECQEILLSEQESIQFANGSGDMIWK